MATTYDAELRVELIPKEKTTLADGSDIATSIDSNIDKTIGGGITFSGIGDWNSSASGDWHYYKNYPLTSTSYINLIDAITTPSTLYNAVKVLVIITSQDGTSGTRVDIQINDEFGDSIDIGTLVGVGDFIFTPLPSGQEGLTLDAIKVKTTTGYECTLDVFIWGVNR